MKAVKHTFDFWLGGCIPLFCEVTELVGDVWDVKVWFDSQAFDPDGIVIDYEDEFLPMREWLIRFVKYGYQNPVNLTITKGS